MALFKISTDKNGKPENYFLIDANPAFENIIGKGRNEVTSQSIVEFLSKKEKGRMDLLEQVALTGQPARYEYYLDKVGKHIIIDAFRTDHDKIAIAISDITQEKQSEELVRHQKLSFEALFRNSFDAIVLVNRDHEIVDINEKFTDLFGFQIEDIRDKELDSILGSVEKLAEAQQLTVDMLNGHEVSAEGIRFGADGQPREVSIKGVMISSNEDIIGGFGIYADISQSRKAEKEILYMNYHDQLTGLYNRRFFEEELARIDIERNLPISVVMADVNGLKLINDAFGHAYGDRLLKKTGELIKKECREDEIIARLGGDEFVILLPRTSSEEAEKIIKRIKAASLGIQLQSMELSISFGWQTKSSIIQNMDEILKNAEDYMYRHKLFESPSIRGKTIKTIINSLHEKNKREEQHSRRVSHICEAIGKAMELGEGDISELRTVGLLHDIGKIAIDEKILNKPERLNDEEWNEMKRHPEIGYRILSSANEMAELAEFVLAHHERWDGKGYPKKLAGEQIPLQARIIMVADAYDAMTSERAYRKPLTSAAAIEEIQKNSGTQFDPEIVQVFIEGVIKKDFPKEIRSQVS